MSALDFTRFSDDVAILTKSLIHSRGQLIRELSVSDRLHVDALIRLGHNMKHVCTPNLSKVAALVHS